MLLSLWLTALLTVVFESSVGEQTIDESSLRLAASGCDAVLQEQHCAASSELEPANAEFFVRLSADPELSLVRVEMHRGSRRGPLSLLRALQLDTSASRDERARAIGLVVAAHVLDVQRSERVERAAAPPVVRPAPRHELSLDTGAWLGPALDTGPLRYGLMLRGSLRWRELPLGLSITAHGAYRFDEPRLSWGGAAVGAFFRQTFARFPLAIEGRLEGVGQHTRVRARQGETSEQTGVLRWGGRLGVDLLLRVRQAGWLFVEGQGTFLRPQVDVFVAGRALGSEPRLGWWLALGGRKTW